MTRAIGATGFEAVLPDGSVVKMQRTDEGNAWGHAFVRYALPLSVPGFGYASVLVRESTRGVAAQTDASAVEPVRALAIERRGYSSKTDREEVGLENGLVRVRFDRGTGRIESFFDKVRGLELLDPEAVAVDLHEKLIMEPLASDEGAFFVSLPPHGIRSVLLREV